MIKTNGNAIKKANNIIIYKANQNDLYLNYIPLTCYDGKGPLTIRFDALAKALYGKNGDNYYKYFSPKYWAGGENDYSITVGNDINNGQLDIIAFGQEDKMLITEWISGGTAGDSGYMANGVIDVDNYYYSIDENNNKSKLFRIKTNSNTTQDIFYNQQSGNISQVDVHTEGNIIVYDRDDIEVGCKPYNIYLTIYTYSSDFNPNDSIELNVYAALDQCGHLNIAARLSYFDFAIHEGSTYYSDLLECQVNLSSIPSTYDKNKINETINKLYVEKKSNRTLSGPKFQYYALKTHILE